MTAFSYGPWLELVAHPGHFDEWEETGNDPGDDELEDYEVQHIGGEALRIYRRKFNPPSQAAKMWARRILG